ncbi:LysR family transcriptional regulator [Aurantimonas sp. VKM B-3413]|uniref:LysR family transcriptional regulator n=1 Tax=Aurantimonas sp. VKM B-3413 TaxID=2779401 RepID=UPI001E299A85|nr:LysR family transcriptional regulator [Aurantimonas sp. VKM B-3413]
MSERLRDALDWDGVKTLLAIVEHESFRQAAADLGRSVNTVRSTIERLEDQLGFRLFYREVNGARLTPEGRRLLASARQVEQSVSDLCRVAKTSSDTMSGEVQLAVTEGIGTFWLVPQLVDFLADTGRDMQVNLRCALRSVDVLRMEADISVQLIEPTSPDLIKKRIGYVHLSPFAGRSYSERHGLPNSLAELADHRVIEQEMDQFAGYGLDKIFTPEIAKKMVPLRTNFASAHYWSIAKGAGLGFLPNYAMAIGGDLVPVPLDLKFRVPIWLAIHPQVIKTSRHRAIVDWLVDCFSTERFPWFGEAFLTPTEINGLIGASGEMKTYFQGFTPRLIAGSSA